MKTLLNGARALLLTAALTVPLQAHDTAPKEYFFGADLSFSNELNDCGVRFSDGKQVKDVYQIFKDHGANLARIRIWHTPSWTEYSTLPDVKRSIARAKKAGMKVLLDFHYSDDWADGDKQVIPAAWAEIETVPELADALYDYTHSVLMELDAEGLTPEMVQVGNETNGEMMRAYAEVPNHPINWARNAALFNAGIKAVRDAADETGKKIDVMLHIAQPENAEPWFKAAAEAGVTDFDYIGLSYYRKWSSEDMAGLGATIKRLKGAYPAEIILVETAYPWTQKTNDDSHNLLGPDTLLEDYPATPEGQRRYLMDVSELVLENGGVGVVYWEPGWVSSTCKTRWGTGSSWENAALFDYSNPPKPLPGMEYLRFGEKAAAKE